MNKVREVGGEQVEGGVGVHEVGGGGSQGRGRWRWMVNKVRGCSQG